MKHLGDRTVEMVPEIANAFGAGIGQAAIWVLVTYVVLRNEYNLKPLEQAWKLYFGCVLVFTLLNFSYKLTGMNTDAPYLMSILMTLVIPPIIVACLLYQFHRYT
jgi:hypothetical protein